MDGLAWSVGAIVTYVGLGIGAALLVALAVAVVRGQRRMRALEERLARAETSARHTVTSRELVTENIVDEDDLETLVPTPLGPAEDDEPVVRVDREMFWDLLLRESFVRVAAVGHGVRAVLDPRTRNRVRFEVRQETKRARKQRKADERAAVRQIRDERLRDSA